MPKNLAGKSRRIGEAPYEVWSTSATPKPGAWYHHVLKKNQANDAKPYAIWFCDVYGPFHEAGDVYVSEVKGAGWLVWRDPDYQAALEEAGDPARDTLRRWTDTSPDGWKDWTR
jgi:hypothetical protein